MKTLRIALLSVIPLLCLLPPRIGLCAADKTLSPYFLVTGENPAGFPLRATSADVSIAGVIADVKIKQVYENQGDQPIEAVYIFPGSTRAAVYSMTMTIGERVIEAKIEERQAARAAYVHAKKAGKRASLLEQQRPNVFQMNVANVMPGDVIVVELAYTELLVPTEGVYEFVYPAVVGPRYSETPAHSASADQRWVANPYLRVGTAPPYQFDIQVGLATGIPIQALSSPSHPIDIQYDAKDRARITQLPDGGFGGDRDYILRYRLQGNRIESGLLLHRGEQENFFLLMMQPPKRVTPEQIPVRDYIFVIDVSGSMHGFPLDTSKRLIKQLLSHLRPSDTFNLLFFAGGNSVLSEASVPATAGNIKRAMVLLDRMDGSGGTRLLPALQRAMALPAPPSTARSFVIITDGYVTVETDAFDYVRDHLDQANFFAFGIGSGVNRFLIEGLARAGRGEPFVVTSAGEAAQQAERFHRYIATPVLTGIEADFDGFDVYDVVPERVPDVFAERPVMLFGKWRGSADGTIRVHGYSGETPYTRTIDVAGAETPARTAALRYLWARHRIAELGDYQRVRPDSDRKDRITRLGLDYNLLTAYTSFIAIDQTVVNPSGENTTVKQPLPLPKGVSNRAVGGAIATAPEPEINVMIGVLALVVLSALFVRRRQPLWKR